jgi:hypothetical protein
MRLFALRRLAAPAAAAAALLAACTGAPQSEPAPSASPAPRPGSTSGPASEVREADVRAQLEALAHDSMEGRMTASPGMWRSARYIARQLQSFGVEAAGDDGYLQRLPISVEPREGRRPRMTLLRAWADTASLPAARRAVGVNVVGVLRGSDPALRDEAVVIGAHFDHLGVNSAGAVAGDSVWNGADDDASGVVAVLETARALAAGPRPRRTVVFLLSAGEELGMLGTNWYVANPAVPLARTVADLQIEMIGRPDSLAGGPGKAWLTGYERSTMGEALTAAGIPIVPDPRPAQGFFLRSDNVAFAYAGIPGHTISSYGMHTDYHRPSDETRTIDYAHMTATVRAVVRAARVVAAGRAPAWKPGGRPARPQAGQ